VVVQTGHLRKIGSGLKRHYYTTECKTIRVKSFSSALRPSRPGSRCRLP
jgi:hypothetical protein